MYNKYLIISLVFILSLISSQALLAQSEMMSENGQDVILTEVLGQIQFVEGRLMDMAKAFPVDKYSWRPDEGIRSAGEVFRHITFANYGFGIMSGLTKPENPDEKPDMKKFEQAVTDKEGIIKDMQKSFEILKSTVNGISKSDMDKQIKVFGMEMSIRNFIITTLNHMHEHLGQSIAYARMNGITPPWSE